MPDCSGHPARRGRYSELPHTPKLPWAGPCSCRRTPPAPSAHVPGGHSGLHGHLLPCSHFGFEVRQHCGGLRFRQTLSKARKIRKGGIDLVLNGRCRNERPSRFYQGHRSGFAGRVQVYQERLCLIDIAGIKAVRVDARLFGNLQVQ